MTEPMRAAVAAYLESACRPGGFLSVSARHSTANLYDASPVRLRVWQEIFDDVLTGADVPREGRAAIITAGPPGAGKTSALHGALPGELSHWRRLDADVIKEHLIRRALLEGTYEDYLRAKLPDDRSLMPLELAGLVHVESVQMVADLRRICMQRGENVVLEGTLSWEPQVDVHLHEIAEHEYDELSVLVVDVPRSTAVERALARWWSGRTDPTSELGGRFVPQAAIDGCFRAGGESICRANAEELIRRARRMVGLKVHTLESPAAGAPQQLRAVGDQ